MGNWIDTDLRGAQVTLIWDGGRVLLGDVRGSYYDTDMRRVRLIVRHFNGDAWPVDPFADAVDVLERDFPDGE